MSYTQIAEQPHDHDAAPAGRRVRRVRCRLLADGYWCSARTLRGRFELPRALRPTRSQVWRVGPSFATSAPRHRPRREIPSLRHSMRGPQRLDIELERHDGLDQGVRLQEPRVDLPEPADLATVEPNRGRASRNEIPVFDRIDVRGPPD